MPTISNFPDLLAAVSPYLASAQPLAAMQAAGFTFDGEVGAALAQVKPAGPLSPTVLRELEHTFGAPLPVRLHVGTPPALPPAPPPAGGFDGVATIRLDDVNPVLAELWNAGTIPRQIPASLIAGYVDLSTLRQYCDNVPTAPDAHLGPLLVASPPVLRAGASNGFIHVDVEFELPVLGTQPASFKGAAHIEIPLGLALRTKGNVNALLRQLRWTLALDSSGAQGALTTLQVAADSVIVPSSSTAQSTIENLLFKVVRDGLLKLSTDYTLSIPAQKKFASFPNTQLIIRQLGAVTVDIDNASFIVAGFTMDPQQPVDPAELAGFSTPASPNDTRAELLEALMNDAVQAFIDSGDLSGYASRAIARYTDNLGPGVDFTAGSVRFQDGNITLTAEFSVHDLATNLTFQASGPPVISDGYLRIGAQYVDVSVGGWGELVGFLASPLVPLGPFLFAAVLIALDGGHDAPAESVNVSLAFTPLPGSDVDWSVVMKQATATDGTLTLDGASTALTSDPRMFVYLRVEEPRLFPLSPAPLAGASVTLFELDDPAPAGDDVVIPPTGTTVTANRKFTTVTSTSYSPAHDQTIATGTADANGDVLFIIDTATTVGTSTQALNDIGGILTTSREETDNFDGNVVSNTSVPDYVLEGKPDFGITVADNAGNVRVTRRLVALNVSGTRVGSKNSPVTVTVPRLVVNAPPAPQEGEGDHSASVTG
jgi:hypothetical protein